MRFNLKGWTICLLISCFFVGCGNDSGHVKPARPSISGNKIYNSTISRDKAYEILKEYLANDESELKRYTVEDFEMIMGCPAPEYRGHDFDWIFELPKGSFNLGITRKGNVLLLD